MKTQEEIERFIKVVLLENLNYGENIWGDTYCNYKYENVHHDGLALMANDIYNFLNKKKDD